MNQDQLLLEVMNGERYSDRLLNLFKTAHSSDQILRISCPTTTNEMVCRELHLHRIILATASPVFERMIFGSMNNKEYIEIQEDNIELFHMLLEYIYARDLPHINNRTESDIRDLMLMAHRYMIHGLVDLCGLALTPSHICDSLFNMLNLGLLLNAKGVIAECTKLIRNHTKEVFEHEDFCSLSAEALVHILKQDELDVKSELEVYKAAITWTQHYIQQSSFTENSTQDYPCTSSPNSKNQNHSSGDHSMSSFTYMSSIQNDMSRIVDNSEVSRSVESNASSYLNNDERMEMASIADSAIDVDSHMTDLTGVDANSNVDDFIVLDDKKECVQVDFKEFGKKFRDVLEKSRALSHIRFLVFTPTEFANTVAKHHILSNNEIAQILLSLNTKHSVTRIPEYICPIKTPRYHLKPKPDYSDGIIKFNLNHIHWLEVVGYVEFEEYFQCVSSRPLIIKSVFIPPKQRKRQVVTQNYEEDLKIQISLINKNGELADSIACGVYKVRRRYGENREYKINYNMTDKGVYLDNGMRFCVMLRFAKDAFYLGGFEHTDESKSNDVIVPCDPMRGFVQGFEYAYIEQ